MTPILYADKSLEQSMLVCNYFAIAKLTAGTELGGYPAIYCRRHMCGGIDEACGALFTQLIFCLNRRLMTKLIIYLIVAQLSVRYHKFATIPPLLLLIVTSRSRHSAKSVIRLCHNLSASIWTQGARRISLNTTNLLYYIHRQTEIHAARHSSLSQFNAATGICYGFIGRRSESANRLLCL